MDNKEMALKAVKEGGKILANNFRGKYTVERKEKHDFVTNVDLKAEKKILEILESSNYSILGEETGEHPGTEKRWIVDPLDGTTNFILNVPVFSSSLALVEGEEIVLSAIYNPITEDIAVAESGDGAYLNGEKLEVSSEDKLEDSFLIFCHGKKPEDAERAVEIYRKFKTICGDLRQLGSASIEFATVASGKAEAFLVPGIPSYDAAPGALLLKEAGGELLDFEGNRWTLSSKNILATNGKINQEILEKLKD